MIFDNLSDQLATGWLLQRFSSKDIQVANLMTGGPAFQAGHLFLFQSGLENQGQNNTGNKQDAGYGKRRIVRTGFGCKHLGKPAHDKSSDTPGCKYKAVVGTKVFQPPEAFGKQRKQRQVGSVVKSDKGCQQYE